MSIIRSGGRKSLAAPVLALAIAAAALIPGSAGASGSSPNGTDGDVVLGAQNDSLDSTTVISSLSVNAFSADSRQGYGVTGASFLTAGVFGTSSFSNGVVGETAWASASGVYGQNDSTGYGVAGRANDGVGVLADSANGVALRANGQVQLSRSGVATVLANHNSVQVTQPGLTPGTSIVVATLQAHVAKLYILGVVVNSSTTFTVYLSKAPASSVQVGWFVLN